ncbi:hypothetical protein EDD18DRAFT_1189252 [Armillaria luteobubalina]|uniref:Uncharacterized protein n=1 Tax=Armillaria luteobubalina TaxID=153913 RepID=A0AA39PSH8_9AGAR|nr:hypothetical protein EDD18DRAFT_1189252 [Armillaria luteobubalina]
MCYTASLPDIVPFSMGIHVAIHVLISRLSSLGKKQVNVILTALCVIHAELLSVSSRLTLFRFL